MNYKICHQIANHFLLKIYDTPANLQKLVKYFKGYQPSLVDGILIIYDLSYHQARLLVNQIPLDLIQTARDITYVYQLPPNLRIVIPKLGAILISNQA